MFFIGQCEVCKRSNLPVAVFARKKRCQQCWHNKMDKLIRSEDSEHVLPWPGHSIVILPKYVLGVSYESNQDPYIYHFYYHHPDHYQSLCGMSFSINDYSSEQLIVKPIYEISPIKFCLRCYNALASEYQHME